MPSGPPPSVTRAREAMSERARETRAAAMWTVAVFFFAIVADTCFQFIHFYTLGVAAIVFAIISVVFSATLIGRKLGID